VRALTRYAGSYKQAINLKAHSNTSIRLVTHSESTPAASAPAATACCCTLTSLLLLAVVLPEAAVGDVPLLAFGLVMIGELLNTLLRTLLPGVLPDGEEEPPAVCSKCVLALLMVSEKLLPVITAGVTGELSAVGTSQLLLLLLLLEVLNVFLLALVLRCCCRLSRLLSFAVAPTFKIRFEFALRFPALVLPLLLLCSGDVDRGDLEAAPGEFDGETPRFSRIA
jgi:hypothetical protein